MRFTRVLVVSIVCVGASKWALAASALTPVMHINAGAMAHPDVGGFWWKVEPATTAPGAADAPNTEYFISAVAPLSLLDDRLAIFSLAGTETLSSSDPHLTLTDAVLSSEVFGNPPSAEQKDGPRPLAQTYLPQLGIKTPPYEKLEFLSGIIDYPQSAVYSGGLLWARTHRAPYLPTGGRSWAKSPHDLRSLCWVRAMASPETEPDYNSVK